MVLTTTLTHSCLVLPVALQMLLSKALIQIVASKTISDSSMIGSSQQQQSLSIDTRRCCSRQHNLHCAQQQQQHIGMSRSVICVTSAFNRSSHIASWRASVCLSKAWTSCVFVAGEVLAHATSSNISRIAFKCCHHVTACSAIMYNSLCQFELSSGCGSCF